MEQTEFEYTTRHRIVPAAITEKKEFDTESAALVVTSPPYPMIAMWDEGFSAQDSGVALALHNGDANRAFEGMHTLLDNVWEKVDEMLIPGGIACINVGDALRTVNGEFGLYPNAARIIGSFTRLGFTVLPRIIWRKTTNAPNKFMGSGMLPGGAYVTLEHEHILIFRKGGKRSFKDEAQRRLRRRSAYFWEERNRWFSDLWELSGERQLLKGDAGRERSAAFPFALAYRLILMYSLQGELVADPFLGTGTTALAALIAGRSSAGWEIDQLLAESALHLLSDPPSAAVAVNRQRLEEHRIFIEAYRERKGEPKHRNPFYQFPVITAQEKGLILPRLQALHKDGDGLTALHGPLSGDEVE